MLQMDVALVLLDPGLDGTASLPNLDFTTLTGHALQARSLESQVILHRPKETGDLLWGVGPHTLYCAWTAACSRENLKSYFKDVL
jgi:hypothetical protein